MADPPGEPQERRPGPSDGSLIARVREGSEDAATALYSRYAQRLLALAKARTGDDLAARVDAEDIVQSVFGSFFRGANQGLYDAPSGEEIWGLLLVIAMNKIRVKARHHRAAKRDVRKTVGGGAPDAEGFDPPATDEAAHTLLRLVVDDVLARLPPGHRDVVRLRLEGFDVAEIAGQTGKSMRTTERVLQDFRARMAEHFKAEGADE
jgi:RNA polymerase sigma-70 factor (ECF subfamily)